jgi:hypothetical protein
MKTRTMLALAAALTTAATTFAPAAEAGMGIRLGFGFPLGGFVARPSGGAHHPAYSSPRGYGNPSYDRMKAIEARREREEAALRRRKMLEAAAERRQKLAEAAAAKREKLAEEAAAAKREKLAEAAAERREKLAARQAEAKEKPEKVEAAAPVASVLVAKATAGTPDGAPNPAETTVNLEDVAEAPAKTKSAKKKPDAPVVTSTEPAAKALDCKMFVPSAGVTVSVPCKE